MGHIHLFLYYWTTYCLSDTTTLNSTKNFALSWCLMTMSRRWIKWISAERLICQVKKKLGLYFCREKCSVSAKTELYFQQIHKCKHLTCLTLIFLAFPLDFSQILESRTKLVTKPSILSSCHVDLAHEEFRESWIRSKRKCPDITLV